VTVAYRHLFEELEGIAGEVRPTLQIALTAPRTLFRSKKYKWRLARNSCFCAGELHPDTSIDERSTRHSLISCGMRLKELQHKLHFEAPALLKNKVFVSEYTRVSGNIRELTDELDKYQPGHGLFGLCIPRRPYNGSKKLQRAAEQLRKIVEDVSAEIVQNKVKAISSMGRH
jgi:hypothetical protein